MRYQSERTIAGSRADVFREFTDLEGFAERVEGIEKIELLTEGPMQVGTRFRETRKMFGREATEEITVTEFDAEKGYVTHAESCGSRYRAAYAFDELPEGTKVSFSFDAEAVKFGAKVMMPVMNLFLGRMMKKCFEKDLDDLTSAIEARR